MKKSLTYLPENYTFKREVDLQKNMKLNIGVNVAALILAIPLLALGFLFHRAKLNAAGDIEVAYNLVLLILAVLLGFVAYIFLHELTHGFFIKRFSGEKPQYGFTGIFAYAGLKNGYFSKLHYIIIALSPVIIWGIVFLVLNILLPLQWFWPVYLLQIINLTGAVGDYYVTYIILRMSPEVLVNDDGVSMRFYEPTAE